MKEYDIQIITSSKKLSFSIQEPETIAESQNILSNKKYLEKKHGIIYFAIAPNPCVDARMHTTDVSFPVDFLFIDWYGNIKKITENAPAFSNQIYTCADCVAVIAINGGECKKYNIEIGDSIIHKNFHIQPDNTIIFQDTSFKKLTKRTISKLNKQDVVFCGVAKDGAIGISGCIQIITQTKSGFDAFFVDKSCWDYKSINHIFPDIADADFDVKKDSSLYKNLEIINMGNGNYLFIRKDFSDLFFNEIKNKNIYKNWIKIATKIL